MKRSRNTTTATLLATLVWVAGCADDSTPSRPEDQTASGGIAGKTTSSAGVTNRGGSSGTGGTTAVGSGGIASVAGQSTTNTAGETSDGAGGAGAGGATTNSGGGNVGTAGSTQVGSGGATAVGGAMNRGGTSGAAGSAGRTATGGVSATGGGATVAGSAGKAATGGAPATGGTPSTGGSATAGSAGLGVAGNTSVLPKCVIYVNGKTGDDWNEGTSWAAARKTVQGGLDKAKEQGGCDVWVAAGIYKPTASTVRTVSIVLRPNIRVFGGFVGTETNFAERNFASNVTTLSGDIGVSGDTTDNSFHVVTGAEGATIDGFTITDGCANSSGDVVGGGVYNAAASLTVSNCIITKNIADMYGAGVYSSGNRLVMRDCSIASNSFTSNYYASSSGAGVMATGDETLIERSRFSSNTAANSGGGLTASGTTWTVRACTFDRNSASVSGSGLYSGGGQGTVEDSVFTNQTGLNGGGVSAGGFGGVLKFSRCSFENNAAGNGGAIFAYSIALEDCRFSSNTATLRGGAVSARTVVANRCSFLGNSASSLAGALSLETEWGYAASSITNSVFFGNSSGSEGAGAIYLFGDAVLKLVNSTIARNTSTVGGAVLAKAVTSQLTLLNSILWQNSPDEISGGTTAATYTINTGSNLAGTGNSGANPQFVDVTTGDLRLKVGSPAINAGTAEGAPAVDLLGVSRDAQPDLGAYEGGVSP